MRLLAVLAALLATGCAGMAPSDPDAEAAFASIEQTLLGIAVLRVDYEVTASGAIAAELRGDLVTQKPALAAATAVGEFAGKPLKLWYAGDGERMRGSAGAAQFEIPAPVALHEGLLLGLTRMGVLHNIAMVSGGAPPDATDGTVRDWVVPSRFAWLEPRAGDAEGVRGLAFSIAVNGRPSGEVSLWFDTETRLPRRREQVVHFEHGDMQVVERYSIQTGGMIGPCRFDLGAASR